MPVITLEEHFTTPEHKRLTYEATRQNWYKARSAHIGHDIETELLDLGESRLRAMDETGITLQVLSLTTPGCQAFQSTQAVQLAHDANERMLHAVERNPQRFRAFAALPTSEPEESVRILEQARAQGFVGAMINGATGGEYLDQTKFWPILEASAALDMPIYLHPSTPSRGAMETYFNGYEDLARPAWGFAIDASTHFLRMVFGGVFDAFPNLKVILGHLGEGIPFGFHRLLDHTPYVAANRRLRRLPEQVLRENLWVTTSGAFSAPAFRCTLEVLGIDRVMFSVDWPYESNRVAMKFLSDLPLSHEDREKLEWRNAARLLRIEDQFN